MKSGETKNEEVARSVTGWLNRLLSRDTVILWLILLVYTYLCVILMPLFRGGMSIGLAWNLFLAILPLTISSIISTQKIGGWKLWVMLAIWLFLFPNAIYTVTDLIHLSDIEFFRGTYGQFSSTDYNMDISVWVVLVKILMCVMFSVVAGVRSLRQVYKVIRDKLGRGMADIGLVAVFLLTGYAVYIGRFLRFNSWDVFRPATLISELVSSFNWFTVQFSLLFAAVMAICYFTFRWIRVGSSGKR